jgi:hypothetical protein
MPVKGVKELPSKVQVDSFPQQGDLLPHYNVLV